jgi:ubiquitin carboxyl-terminal hydrolase 14
VEQFMGIECSSETKCVEAEEEEPTKSVEKFLQYSCYIDKDVKYLHTGLKNRLAETIEKHSPTLNRDATYTKTLAVTRLPGYITIQMVRFHFKQKEEGGGINAKILKDIKFPAMLDMFDMCSTELQEKLRARRTEFKDYEDWLVENKVSLGKGKVKSEAAKDERTAQDSDEHEDWWFPDDVGSNNSGYYVLQAVLTHKGRSSNSGHYVGWVRQKGETWLKCDDDEVSPVHEEDVMKLSGGGDWHTAYLLVYAPRKLPKERGQKKAEEGKIEEMETS